jgi:Uma2 family endonuclease
MATVEATPTPDAGTILSGLTDTGIVLEGVSWETYERLLAGLGDRRVFVTYDRGTMEIQTMSPSYKHKNDDRFLEQLIATTCLLQNIPMRPGGSVTMRRADLKKGLEPDGCFWIARADALRGVEKLDLTKHPAPDLVVEVDIHADSIDRLDSYRTLGVSEVWWRREKEGLCFLRLNRQGEYEEVGQSVSLPILSSSVVAEALEENRKLSETERLNLLLNKLGLR